MIYRACGNPVHKERDRHRNVEVISWAPDHKGETKERNKPLDAPTTLGKNETIFLICFFSIRGDLFGIRVYSTLLFFLKCFFGIPGFFELLLFPA